MVDNIVTMFDQVQIPDSSKREKEMGKKHTCMPTEKGREEGERRERSRRKPFTPDEHKPKGS